MKRLRLSLKGGILCAVLSLTFSLSAGERFGDVLVAPQTMALGETHHGYREYRVLVENQSLHDPHTVTLNFPDESYGNGNHIRRMSRTVTVGPQARVLVPLWQPPLPTQGAWNFRVIIDNDIAGKVSLPGQMPHANMGARYGSVIPATVLVSRSVNHDDATKAFKGENAAFAPAAATGPADARGARGMVAAAWMPDTSASTPHWLELTMDKPIPVQRVQLFTTLELPSTPSSGGEILLQGASGTNLARIPLTPTTYTLTPEFTCPVTSEPVKTVRLSFGSTYAGQISIDAVQLDGPSGSTWASAAKASSQSTSTPAYGGGEVRQLLRSELGVSDWSEAWLSYTPYEAVLLTAGDMRTMPLPVAAALWRYVECGGNLFLLGGGDVPEPWRSRTKVTVNGVTRYAVGFGRCLVIGNANVAEIKAESIKVFSDTAGESARGWQSMPDELGANAAFPVVENFRVPVRSTVFIMLAFVIVIGPANIIILARRNRRTWLLWTIPAISFTTCLVVFAYSLLREGITPDVRIEGITLLDQVNRRASTVGNTAFYCPLTPSQGLMFGMETEAMPLVQPWNYRNEGSPRELDWTRGQHLQRGWVKARVPAHFYVRKSEVRRERIELENVNGQLSVVNGLGASIQNLWLADSDGHVYTASGVVEGQKALLAPCKEFPKLTGRLGPRSILERSSIPYIAAPLTDRVSYLEPGTYIAELDSNPFIENGLGAKAKSARTKERAIVFGILETAVAATYSKP